MRLVNSLAAAATAAAIAFALAGLPQQLSAQPEFPDCEGLKGPALGLCKAGTQVGCQGNESGT